ncbi:hypothetical protein JYU34_007004 [Plutella xylostella]|uniref:Uncharacterized protein n=1 Tax=Plutella xylostella TaxID=51655 RepID=A0ABQ7QPD3_PLUXY|nr:hypothetical protein JYU34_007004 [Plutella xylostella]
MSPGRVRASTSESRLSMKLVLRSIASALYKCKQVSSGGPTGPCVWAGKLPTPTPSQRAMIYDSCAHAAATHTDPPGILWPRFPICSVNIADPANRRS